MKTYLLDTNIASILWDARHGDQPKAETFIRSEEAKGNIFYASCVAIAETRYGLALYSNLDITRKTLVEKSINGLTLIKNINKHTTSYYAEIKAEMFRQHAPKDAKGKITKKNPNCLKDSVTGIDLAIDENDLWLAACALEANLTLVSEDKMDWIKDACKTLSLNLDLVKWKI
jgi:tRNA(fMet)-specific endonuclease VapC